MRRRSLAQHFELTTGVTFRSPLLAPNPDALGVAAGDKPVLTEAELFRLLETRLRLRELLDLRTEGGVRPQPHPARRRG